MANTYTATPQRHQLTLKMDAPLWDDQQVNLESDLQNIKYTYPGKLVWVKSENGWFYYINTELKTLPSGETINFQIWKRQYSRTSIEPYTIGKNYIEGESVFAKGKIYNAVRDIIQVPSPPNMPVIPYEDDNHAYWVPIAGMNEYIKYEFDDMTDFIIQSDIVEPLFAVWVKFGDNYENIQPSIEKISGVDFKFSFWEYDFNNEIVDMVPKSGYVILK